MEQYIQQNTCGLHLKNNQKVEFIAFSVLMRCRTGILPMVFALFLAITGAWSPQAGSADRIMTVKMSAIHPTQPAIGFAEVQYSLACYRKNTHTLFDDYCKDSGAGKVVSMTAQSTLTELDIMNIPPTRVQTPRLFRTHLMAVSTESFALCPSLDSFFHPVIPQLETLVRNWDSKPGLLSSFVRGAVGGVISRGVTWWGVMRIIFSVKCDFL